ncbi:glycosyltransferase family 9 protein [Bernardetia sp. OM2101]|uniref:glycosyltransferase family 9 protein n=1 Tax=Bernardetia sp. OM2101 TaxID=3344876 RepID=UPI0035D124C9
MKKINPTTIQKIAIFAPNKPFFGAILVQFPFFLLLREVFPHAKIKIWSPTGTSNLILNNNLADEIELYHKSKSYTRTLRSLRSFSPDLLINLRHQSEVTHLLSAASGAKFRIGVVSSKWQKSVYQHSIFNDTSCYRALLYLRVLEELLEKQNLYEIPEIKFEDFKNLDSSLSISKKENEEENTLFSISKIKLNEAENQICLLIGGGEGEHKRWGIQNFIALAKLILKEKPSTNFVFLVGSAEDEDLPFIEKELSSNQFQVFKNAEIPQLISILKQCQVTVANDCGPSHAAQMLEGNYISVWGWEKQHPYQRIGEWFLSRENSSTIVAHYQKSIKTISPKRVFSYVKSSLEI